MTSSFQVIGNDTELAPNVKCQAKTSARSNRFHRNVTDSESQSDTFLVI